MDADGVSSRNGGLGAGDEQPEETQAPASPLTPDPIAEAGIVRGGEQPASAPVEERATRIADAQPAGSSQQSPVASAAAPPSTRRGMIFLAICVAFALALLMPNLFGSAASTPPAPCGEGAMISQVAAGPAGANAAPYLLAVVRPPAFPNVAPGNEPGCVALYRSDDNGMTWTISFSATAEAPAAVALAPTGSVYLLTQRLQFPLYLAGNIYRSDAGGAAWTWSRVSPQGRHDVPMVSATDMLVQDDGSVILREGNGDGAALIVSRDGGDTWQPVVIPRLLSVGSVTSLGLLIAVAPPLLAPGRSPGMVSSDHGLTWRAMGSLPGAPSRADLRPLLSASSSEHALIMDLVPAGQGGPVRAAARFVSLDGGRHWTRVMCAARPSPGCAVSTRWAEAAGERYVLYRHQIFFAPAGHPWMLVTAQLPVPSDTVQQLLAVPARPHAVLYLVAASGIWRWQDGAWHPSSTGLPLGGPTPTQG